MAMGAHADSARSLADPGDIAIGYLGGEDGFSGAQGQCLRGDPRRMRLSGENWVLAWGWHAACSRSVLGGWGRIITEPAPFLEVTKDRDAEMEEEQYGLVGSSLVNMNHVVAGII